MFYQRVMLLLLGRSWVAVLILSSSQVCQAALSLVILTRVLFSQPEGKIFLFDFWTYFFKGTSVLRTPPFGREETGVLYPQDLNQKTEFVQETGTPAAGIEPAATRCPVKRSTVELRGQTDIYPFSSQVELCRRWLSSCRGILVLLAR